MSYISAIIVDDEFFNRELLKMMILRLNGAFSITGEADSLHSALKLIEDLQPDVVFSDIRMPDGSGLDLLRDFPSRRFEAVIVTGNDDYLPADHHLIAAGYVLKPIDMEKLRSVLKEVESRIAQKRVRTGGQQENP